jgi:transitional endoplasmic reticulum ATPase
VDAVITIDPPDAASAERLVRLYAGETLNVEVDITEVGKALAGNIPAAIREVVERAKLAALPRAVDGKTTIDIEDLTFAAASMRRHLEMLKEKPREPETEMEMFGKGFGKALRQFATDRRDGIVRIQHDPDCKCDCHEHDPEPEGNGN